MQRLLSELEFGALLAYSPRGQSWESRRSRNIRIKVKQDGMVSDGQGGHAAMSCYVARWMANHQERLPFADWFHAGVTLVPVPRSSLMRKGYLWPPFNVARALVDAGLAGQVLRILERHTAIPKAATAAPGTRPMPMHHFDSLVVRQVLDRLEDVVLVDDVVTKGATLLGAACRLREVFPLARIRAFAVMRTRGLVPEIGSMLDPVQGVITWSGEDAQREP